jgi:hypothetical protein
MTGEKPKAEPLADPQARHLLATGAEAEALEAEYQERIEKAYRPEFLAWAKEFVERIKAQAG